MDRFGFVGWATMVSFGQKLIANLRAQCQFAGMLQQEEHNADRLFAQMQPGCRACAILPSERRGVYLGPAAHPQVAYFQTTTDDNRLPLHFDKGICYAYL
jgi:hypothetical protein